MSPPSVPESEDEAVTPVSGAPFGTTETWPRDDPRTGAALGTAETSVVGTALGVAEPRVGAGVGVALRVGATVAVGRTVGTGLGFAPWADAGTVPASTAVQASAMP